MTALALAFDPLRDKRYQLTRLGRDVVDFLAWLDAGGKTPSTLDSYERALARGCVMFPDVPVEEWTDSELLHVSTSFSPAERRVRMAAWASFFKWARRTRRIRENPVELLPEFKRQPKKVYDLFTDAERAILCGLPVHDGALFELMFGAGPRKGDCVKFQLKHWRPEATLDAPYGMLVFLGGKGGKDRQIPATQRIAQRLADLSILDALEPDDHLWYTRPQGRSVTRTKPLGEASFYRWWVRCLDEAGVRHRNPHMTRHTFATGFLRRGGRMETLQLVLGHESIATTIDEYAHLDMRDVAIDLGLLQENAPDVFA